MPDLKISKNISLAPYTTFKIGGPAQYFCQINNSNEVLRATRWARENHLPYFILGGGSNVLFSDHGFSGLVIKLPALPNVITDKSNTKLIFGAGILLSKIVAVSLEKNLTGLEWAIGIPGTLGGAVRGNAGAMGQSMADIIDKVEAITVQGKIETWTASQCQFSYRDSIFKKNKNNIILSVTLNLSQGNPAEIKKRTQEYFYQRVNQPKEPSAGCVFKNIAIDKLDQKTLNELLVIDTEVKNKIKNNKLAAGYLLEKVGLKGQQIGQARFSPQHANFIVNLGGAKAIDVLSLIQLAKEKIKDEFNIILEEEIEII